MAQFGSGSRVWVDGSAEFGTAGCLVTETGVADRVLMATASHVVSRQGASVGKLVRANNLADAIAVGPCIGQLVKWAPLVASGTPVDLALIWVDPAQVSVAAFDGGAFAGINTEAAPGMSVICRGAGTGGMVSSTILGVGVDAQIPFSDDGNSDFHTYPKQIICEQFDLPGDSGAAVLDPLHNLVGFIAGVAPAPPKITSATGFVSVVVPVLTAFSGGPWARLNLLTQMPAGATAPPGLADVPAVPVTQPGGSPDSDLDVMARTLWAEDRAGGATGMAAVAAVIMNRLRNAQRTRFGATVADVCQKRLQFSCWNPGIPGYAAQPSEVANFNAMKAVDTTDADFRTALQIATQAMQGNLPDPTGGATHYVATSYRNSFCNRSGNAGIWICSTDTVEIRDQIYIRNVA